MLKTARFRNFNSILKTNIYEFLSDTTVQAIPKILKVKETFSKFFWSVFFILSSASCGYFIYLNLGGYFEYQVITNINVIEASVLPFPKVTICYMAMPINITIAPDRLQFQYQELSKNTLRQVNGHCIDFNSGFDQSGYRTDVLNTTDYGYENGLWIVLKNPNVSSTFDVYISNQSEGINTYKAIKFGSNLQIDLQIAYEHTDRLGEPYSDCKQEITVQQKKFPYSQHNCLVQCSYRELASRNNKTAEFEAIERFFYSDSVTFDARFKSLKASFVNVDIIEEKARKLCLGMCPSECYSVEYSVESFVNLGNNWGEYGILRVYNKELKYKLVNQYPKISGVDFFGLVGGHFSVFLGISLLSLIEIVEFIDVLVNLIKEF